MIKNGYRPDWNIGNDTFNGGRVNILNGLSLLPGNSTDALIDPLIPENWSNVAIGQVISMHEGPNIVGYATIITI